ncbi:gp50 [Brochothrix phage NF5]|uniref:gp50 n=1 Tax=Brochothrix phage NF5 TaxID=764561 RepID=UPI0001D9ACBD|nr:gp50 [Brochothrix phage NF5]ADH03072.1 gp50 [Brochothrix phage NF5]
MFPVFEVGGKRSPWSIVALCPFCTSPPRGPTSTYFPAGLLSSPGLYNFDINNTPFVFLNKVQLVYFSLFISHFTRYVVGTQYEHKALDTICSDFWEVHVNVA